jgi:kynurenine formamidase
MSNWGRWGADDERGALNLLTPEGVVSALGYAKTGRVYSLALEIRRDGVPVYPARNPALHMMSIDGGDYAAGVRLNLDGVEVADDYIFMATHGTTHVDALSHAWYDRAMYNGFDPNRVRSYGATKLGIENVGWIVARGVLLDIAGFKGVDVLPRGYSITTEDLEGCCQRAEVQIESGDVVLIRTGWLSTFAADPAHWFEHQPGISIEAATYLGGKDIVAVGADNIGVEHHGEDEKSRAVHRLFIRDLGVYMMELLVLDELATDASRTFAFMAAPLKITGGVGGPMNPLAIT